MNKPRILIIENAIDITGGLKSIVRSSMSLRDNFEFNFVIPYQSQSRNYLVSRGFDVYEFPMLEIKKDFFSAVLYFPILFVNSVRLFSLVKRLKVDLIVSNDLYNLIPALYKFFGGRIPYVVYVRFLPSKFPKSLIRFWGFWNRRFASSTVTVSQAVKKELPYQYNVVCIGGELPELEKPYEPTSSTIILYLSNYIQGKGQEFALQSFALLNKEYPQWKLRFVGGDMGLLKNKQFKEQLIGMSERLGLKDEVEWNEFEEDISKEYGDASFVLNFSESESFSLTCLESMYYGRPVIATKSGGPVEIIDHKETGILVELRDIDGMAGAIEYLITHPEEREVMAKKAFQSVRERFSYSNTIEKLKLVYQSALLK